MAGTGIPTDAAATSALELARAVMTLLIDKKIITRAEMVEMISTFRQLRDYPNDVDNVLQAIAAGLQKNIDDTGF